MAARVFPITPIMPSNIVIKIVTPKINKYDRGRAIPTIFRLGRILHDNRTNIPCAKAALIIMLILFLADDFSLMFDFVVPEAIDFGWIVGVPGILLGFSYDSLQNLL